MDLATAQTIASSTVTALQAQLSGVLPVMYPAGIAVASLFAGYGLIKAWYHHRF